RVEYEGEFRRSNSAVFTSLFGRASGIEILRFYGFGNETSNAGPDQSYKARQDQLVLEPSVGVFLTPRLTLSLGPRVKYAKTDLAPGRFITAHPPYGVDKFGEAGLGGALRFDSRDHPANATRGLLFDTAGSFYPKMWDVKTAFGEVHGDVATYLSASSSYLQPTLALRAGGGDQRGAHRPVRPRRLRVLTQGARGREQRARDSFHSSSADRMVSNR